MQTVAKSKPESVNFLLPRLQFCNLSSGLVVRHDPPGRGARDVGAVVKITSHV